MEQVKKKLQLSTEDDKRRGKKKTVKKRGRSSDTESPEEDNRNDPKCASTPLKKKKKRGEKKDVEVIQLDTSKSRVYIIFFFCLLEFQSFIDKKLLHRPALINYTDSGSAIISSRIRISKTIMGYSYTFFFLLFGHTDEFCILFSYHAMV